MDRDWQTARRRWFTGFFGAEDQHYRLTAPEKYVSSILLANHFKAQYSTIKDRRHVKIIDVNSGFKNAA